MNSSDLERNVIYAAKALRSLDFEPSPYDAATTRAQFNAAVDALVRWEKNLQSMFHVKQRDPFQDVYGDGLVSG